MTILEKLSSLGFENAHLISEAKGKSTLKIRTSKGWVYERFSSEDEAGRWANFHSPEVSA